MCSQKYPTPFASDDAHILAAVTSVAEYSFFAFTEPCDARRFEELAAAAPGWIVATVGFEEDGTAGSLSCTLSEDLARVLFQSFTGQARPTPAPWSDEMADLIGEFTNMVCGSWLTRSASHQKFRLHRPVVAASDGSRVPDPDSSRVLLAVNDLPLAVDVRFTVVSSRAGTRV